MVLLAVWKWNKNKALVGTSSDLGVKLPTIVLQVWHARINMK